MTDQRILRIRITGQVQGVWFRAWTQREAQRLGLRGWVRNEADGSVAALIAGSDAAVAEMIAALHSGPEHARVDRVDVEDVEDAVPEAFEVRR